MLLKPKKRRAHILMAAALPLSSASLDQCHPKPVHPISTQAWPCTINMKTWGSTQALEEPGATT